MATAKGEKVDSLYLSLGLDLTQLDLDFVRADQTVAQNINRLQRETRNANLKIDVVMTDPNLSEAEKAKVVQQQLTEIIARQRQEVELATRAWQAEAAAAGETAASAQNLQKDMLMRQRELNLALMRQKELQSQNAVPVQGDMFSTIFNQLTAMSPVMSTFVNSLSAAATQAANAQKAIEEMKKAAASSAAISALQEESSIMGQLTGKAKELAELFKALPGPLKAAAVGLGALSGAIALDKMAISAVEGKAAVHDLAIVLGTSSAEAGKFKKVLGLMGVDADAASTALNRFRNGLMAAGEKGNETTRMLDYLGVEYKNLDGSIKTSDQLFFELASHMGEFNQMGISQDVILKTLGLRGAQYAAALAKVNAYLKAADEVKPVSFISPDEAAAILPMFRTMNGELTQLGGVFKQTLIPFAKITLPVINKLLQKSAELIAAFKPEITAIMSLLGLSVDSVLGLLYALVRTLLELKKIFNEFMTAVLTTFNILTNIGNAMSDSMNGIDIQKKYLVEYTNLFDILIAKNEEASMSEEEAAEKRKGFFELSSEAAKNAAKTAEDAEKELQSAHERALKNMQTAQDTYYHATHSEVENRIYDINEEMSRELKAAKSAEEAYSIRAKAAAKLFEIEQEGHKAAMDNYAEAAKTYYHMNHGATDNKIFDIQSELDSQLKAARTAEESESIVAKAAARMSEAWKDATDSIKEANQSLDDEIFKLTHNDADNKRFDLMQKAQRYLEQGADENKVMQFLNLSDQKLRQEDREAHKDNPTYNPYRSGYMSDISSLFKEAMGRAWDKRKDLMPAIQTPSMDSFNGAVTQLREVLNGGNGFTGAVQRFQGAVQEMSMARNRPQVIQLNVDVSGLGDVSNVVAQEAAQKILERLPSGTQVNLAY